MGYPVRYGCKLTHYECTLEYPTARRFRGAISLWYQHNVIARAWKTNFLVTVLSSGIFNTIRCPARTIKAAGKQRQQTKDVVAYYQQHVNILNDNFGE